MPTNSDLVTVDAIGEVVGAQRGAEARGVERRVVRQRRKLDGTLAAQEEEVVGEAAVRLGREDDERRDGRADGADRDGDATAARRGGGGDLGADGGGRQGEGGGRRQQYLIRREGRATAVGAGRDEEVRRGADRGEGHPEAAGGGGARRQRVASREVEAREHRAGARCQLDGLDGDAPRKRRGAVVAHEALAAGAARRDHVGVEASAVQVVERLPPPSDHLPRHAGRAVLERSPAAGGPLVVELPAEDAHLVARAVELDGRLHPQRRADGAEVELPRERPPPRHVGELLSRLPAEEGTASAAAEVRVENRVARVVALGHRVGADAPLARAPRRRRASMERPVLG